MVTLLFSDYRIILYNHLFPHLAPNLLCALVILNVSQIFFYQCHHMSLMDFVVFLPGCGQRVTDF
jgi:hypothetical protein